MSRGLGDVYKRQLFLVPWSALAVPLATSAYPGLSERAESGDRVGFARALAPAAVLTVAASALAAALLVATAAPVSRVFFGTSDAATVAALRDTIAAFAPGLVGYGLVALLTRALYAQGLWKAPTVCVVSGWLLAVAADVVLSAVLPAGVRGAALALGHTLGVTTAGLALLVVVLRVAGRGALRGLPRAGLPAVLAAVIGAAAGMLVGRLLGVVPDPPEGVAVALGAGVVIAGTVLLVAAAVIMGTARGPLRAAVRALRTGERQEVHGG